MECSLKSVFSGDTEDKRPLAADFLLFPVIQVNSETRGTRRLGKAGRV